MQSGIYSGCLAIIIDDQDQGYNKSFVSAISKFKAIEVVNVAQHDLQSLPDIYHNDKYLIAFGLDEIERKSTKAHRIRTALDIRRNNGNYTIIHISKAAFKYHFYENKSPFYLFCDSIPVEDIIKIEE